MKTHIEAEPLPNRTFNRLPWQIREVRKAELMQTVRDGLFLCDEKPKDPACVVEIGIRKGKLPETMHLNPVILVLRNDGWIRDDATVIITPSTTHGIFIAI